jgi:hypothetical protein
MIKSIFWGEKIIPKNLVKYVAGFETIPNMKKIAEKTN